MQYFPDRRLAGQALAAHLLDYVGRPDVVVLALPRGGVPVGYEVAEALRAPLDIAVVRKLGVPGMPEVAMGAIAGGKVCVLNRDVLRDARVSDAALGGVIEREREELRRRERAYRGTRPVPHVAGKIVILVDDGLATGATMLAAAEAVQRQHAAHVVVAVPVASHEAVADLTAAGCSVKAVLTPWPFRSVSAWYEDFEATGDAEVVALLDAAWRRAHPPRDHATAPDMEVEAPRQLWAE